MSKIAKKLTDLIGDTPLLELGTYRDENNLEANLIAKVEYFNPLGSVKDRVANAMIETAIKEGKINKDTVIIEPTSGNTGIGLAFVTATKGLHLILTMPETMSIERRRIVAALGAEVVLTPGAEGMKGAIAKAEALKEEYGNAFIPQQFENEANPKIHFETTGPEIWRDTDGKVDIFVTYEDYTDAKVFLKYNRSLAQEYMDSFKKMSDDFGIDNDVKVSMLARCPEVLTMEEVPEDEEHMWELLKNALLKACEGFVESRIREGENLKNDLIGKLDHMLELVDFIEERSPKVIAEYRQKLEDKVKELLASASVDDSRIATEVTIFADKICVDEETVRLRSHIEGMKKELLAGGSVGRKLDFIAQEMNREANTILSKSTDLEISDRAILLKTEVEKVREQIQNIE